MTYTARSLLGLAVSLLVVMALVFSFPIPAQAASPGWIVTCSLSHQNNDDPILFPNQPGRAHLHQFAGALSTDAFSTPDSLRAGGTNCVIPGDTSAYWIPRLFEDGEPRDISHPNNVEALFYYRRKAVANGVNVSTIPDGLRMIVGDMHSTDPNNQWFSSGIIEWACGPGSLDRQPTPPTHCDSSSLIGTLIFPNCWNGRDLDSPDHISHMSYPVNSRCPSTHPVNIPRIEAYFRFPLGPGPIGEISLSSGPWWTFHTDFFNAWDQGVLQRLMNECINANRDCGTNPQLGSAPTTTTAPLPTTTTTAAPTTTASTTTTHHPTTTTTTTTSPPTTTTQPPTTTTTQAPTTTTTAPSGPTADEIITRIQAAAVAGTGYHLNRTEVRVMAEYFRDN